MNKYVMLAIWLLCSAVVVYGGPPPGPFNPDGDTVLLLHFDDTTYIDLSPNAFSVSMSTIAGYSDPTIGTSMYGFGKALFGAGGNINGLIIDTTGSISRTEGPITIEAWYILPSVNSTLEYSNCVLDLGAGRFLLSIRNPGIPADTSGNHYMQLVAYTLSGSPQWDYCSIRPQDGFTYDEWHHYAMVYDISEPIDVDKVKFYFDGNQIATNLGGTPITEAYWKIYYPALAAGRVWIPTAPTTNLMPLRGAVDELRFSKGKRYPAGFPSSALVIPASRCTTLTIDGNPSDWSSTTSIAIHCDFSASTTGGKLACDVKFAWDASYLYILVQETAGDTTQNEAANGSLYSAAPWAFDGISFWIDLDNNNDNRTSPSIGDFNPWFGFSSLGRNDLYIARVNNDAGLVLAPFANGTVATGGSFTSHNRVIEARLSWSDIVSSVDTARQPGGNLLSAISIGFKFGCEPLLIDDNYTKQTFIGGSQYTPPTGADMNSRDIQLVHDSTMEPTFAIHWELYE